MPKNRRSSVPITKFKKAISKLNRTSVAKSTAASAESSIATESSLSQTSISENAPIIEDIDETLGNLDLDHDASVSEELEHDNDSRSTRISSTTVQVAKLQVFNLSNFREKFDLPQPEMLSLSIDGKKMTLGRK